MSCYLAEPSHQYRNSRKFYYLDVPKKLLKTFCYFKYNLSRWKYDVKNIWLNLYIKGFHAKLVKRFFVV